MYNRDYEAMNKGLIKPVNKVTTTNLDLALRMVGISMSKKVIDKIIDLVELIEEKGDEVTILDICNLQKLWQFEKDSTE